MSFDGKTVLVTGATSGIGRASAELFARQGAHVIVSGRDQARAEETVGAIEAAGGKARFLGADLGDSDAVLQLARDAGEVDVLVNNGGVFPFGMTHEFTAEQLREVLDVNVVAPFVLVGALAPAMVARGGGAIVSVSTVAARNGMAPAAAYGGSKAAIELFTKSWAGAYGPHGVRVNAVAPGPVRTPGTSAMDADTFDAIIDTVPMKRAASAEEIADAIVYLASDAASYVNGAILPVDGGRVAV